MMIKVSFMGSKYNAWGSGILLSKGAQPVCVMAPSKRAKFCRLGDGKMLRNKSIVADNRSVLVSASSRQEQRVADVPGTGWKVFWSTVDVGAWMGALGGAAAFVVTQEVLFITGPLVLPLLALYASNERNRIDLKVSQAKVQEQVRSAMKQVIALSEEGAVEIVEEVAEAIERMNKEKSMNIETWENLGDDLKGVLSQMEKLQQSVENGEVSSSKGIKKSSEFISESIKKVRIDIRNDFQAAATEEVAALSRLDARLSALEGAIAGLEMAQSESFKRLSGSISSSRNIDQDVVSSAVQAEVWRSLEPVRQLPQMLSQTLPQLSTDNKFLPSLTSEGIQSMLSAEIGKLKQEMLTEQQILMEELSSSLGEEPNRWEERVGERLKAIDDKIRDVDKAVQVDGRIYQMANELERSISLAMNEIQSLSQKLSGAESVLSSAMEGYKLDQTREEQLRGIIKESLQKNLSASLSMDDAAMDEASRNLLDSILKILLDAKGIESSQVSSSLDGHSSTNGSNSDVILSEIVQGLKDIKESLVFLSNGNILYQKDFGQEMDEAYTDKFQQGSDNEDAIAETGLPFSSWFSSNGGEIQEKVPIKTSQELILDQESGKGAVDSDSTKDEPLNKLNQNTWENNQEMQQEDDLLISNAQDENLNFNILYTKGVSKLQNGRKALENEDFEDAESLLDEASQCFSKILSNEPTNIRALGNKGNALMALAKSKLMMANALVQDGFLDTAASQEEDAQSVLLEAGRLYKKILETYPDESKAFINWGRAICLRAELAESAGDSKVAYSLFCNAADKFVAAVESSKEGSSLHSEAARLAGTSLIGAYLCTEAFNSSEDHFRLLNEAEKLLKTASADRNPQVSQAARSKLVQCRELMGLV